MEASVRQHLQKLVVGSHPNQKKVCPKWGHPPKDWDQTKTCLKPTPGLKSKIHPWLRKRTKDVSFTWWAQQFIFLHKDQWSSIKSYQLPHQLPLLQVHESTLIWCGPRFSCSVIIFYFIHALFQTSSILASQHKATPLPSGLNMNHLATQPLNHSAKVTEVNWRIDGVASLVGRTFAHVEIQPRFDQKTFSSFSRRLGGSFMKLHFLVVDVESSYLPSQVSYANNARNQ